MKILRSFKFWVLFIVSFYTLFGFAFIPWFVSNKVPGILKDKVGLHVEIGKTKFNPYTFDLKIENILIKDLQNRPAISFKKLHLDYELLGLFDKMILFKTLDISSPKLYATIQKDGKINLQNILPSSNSKQETKSQKDATTLPVIKLSKLNITNGSIAFSDLKGEKPFNMKLGPYSFKAHDISTKTGDLNGYRFQTKINKTAQLFWEGGMRIDPLSMYGEVRLTKLNLPQIYDYVLPDFDASLSKGLLSLSLPYKIDFSKGLIANINNAKLTLSNILLQSKKTQKKLIEIPNIKLNSLNFKWPKQDILIEDLTLQEPKVFASLDKKYELNLLNAFKSKQAQSTTPAKSSSTEWKFLLKQANINSANLTFTDASLDQPITTQLSKTSLHVKNISLDKLAPINYTISSTINQNSSLKAEGKVQQEPLILSSKIDLANFRASDYKAYIAPYVNFDLKNADVSIKAKVNANFTKKQNIKLQADALVSKLLIDGSDGNKLLSWNKFFINGIKYNHKPMSIDIKNLKLDNPYIRAHIAKDGVTNFSNLTKTSKKKNASSKTTSNTKPLQLKIGPMVLLNGTSDYSDLSLPFPFKTHIHDLNGKFSVLDFQKTTPSTLSLKGKIDKYGYADINGVLSPFNIKENAKLNLLFKNIDLNTMTPYSGKFVGYKIKSGKLSMDLKYTIKQSKLIGDNQINIDTIILGDKVESPDAPSLPLELAIALLKDSNGQIDIDMPVTGDLNNPKFSYGSVIWRAVGNLITGIVTAPFRFLGSMLGVNGDELKAIDFDKGSFALISTEYEKLDNLNKILSKRPGIKLSIAGGYDEKIDTYELQKQKFKTLVNKELAKDINSTKKDVYGTALKSLYLKEFTLAKYDTLRKDFVIVQKENDNKTKKTKEVKKDKEPQIDIVAFNNALQKEITTNIKIDQKELEKLANKRADSVKKELVTKYKVAQERINILPPKIKEAKRDRWIESELEIAI